MREGFEKKMKAREKKNALFEKKLNDFVKFLFNSNSKIRTININITSGRNKYREGKKGIKSEGLFFKRSEFREELK